MDLNNYNPPSPNFQGYLGGNPIGSKPSQGAKKISGLGVLGLIGAGIDIASGLMGVIDSVSGSSAKRQQRYQKELMDKQQSQWKEQQNILAQQQLDQWNRENEYNDPTNYFKRLMAGADANGLSKAAVLGDMPGGSVGQSATGVTVPGSTSAPGVGGSTLLPFGSSNVLGAMRQRAEISNIEADSQVKRAQAGLVQTQTTLTEISQETQRALTINYSSDTYAKKMAGLLSYTQSANIETLQPFEINRIISQAAEASERSYLLRKDNDKYDARFNMEMDLGMSLILLRGAQRSAEDELRKFREFDNSLFQKTIDYQVQDIINNATLSGHEANMYRTNQWFNRIATVLGLGVAAASAASSARNGRMKQRLEYKMHNERMSLDRQALDLKSRLTNRIVSNYRMDKNGRMSLSSQTIIKDE